jgi:hypothetical protein
VPTDRARYAVVFRSLRPWLTADSCQALNHLVPLTLRAFSSHLMPWFHIPWLFIPTHVWLPAGAAYCCSFLRQSVPCQQHGQGSNPVLQDPVLLALAENCRARNVWHDMCTEGCCMNTIPRWLLTLRGLRRRMQPTGTQQPESVMIALASTPGRASTHEWSLHSHSPGQEPWVLGLQELFRLQREAGDADGPVGELAASWR